MKQGSIYTRVILWLFLAAVVCYFGYYVVTAVYAPLTTETAIEYEAGGGAYTTGYVVRQESLIYSTYEITTLVVAEGERVAAGQTVATGYRDENAQARQSQIDSLEHQLEQLELAGSYSTDAADQAELDSQIQTDLENMSRYIARRDLNSAQDHSAALKGLILRRSSSDADNEAMDKRILQLKEELAQLRSQSSADTRVVAANEAGVFSGSVDGYEQVLTPQLLDTVTIAQLDSLEPGEINEQAVGKLVTSSVWYYVTAVDDDLVQELRAGDQVPVSFSSLPQDDLVMTVVRIGQEENGQKLLILSADRYLQDATLLRAQSADVAFSSYTGLRVPKEAIRVTEDQRTGVYVLESNTAVWKYVTLLYDNSESYVVELDKSSTENLWPGDEIIVGDRDLYNGKVVR